MAAPIVSHLSPDLNPAASPIMPSQSGSQSSGGSHPAPVDHSHKKETMALAVAAPLPPLLRFRPHSSSPRFTAIALNKRRPTISSVGSASNSYAGGRASSTTTSLYWRIHSCLVVPPPSGHRPRVIIKILGGAFIGAVPEVTYIHLMELLVKDGFLIVSVLYNVTFDHTAAATEVYHRFHFCLDRLFVSGLPSAGLTVEDLAALPLYSVGHSNGGAASVACGKLFLRKVTKGQCHHLIQQQTGFRGCSLF